MSVTLQTTADILLSQVIKDHMLVLYDGGTQFYYFRVGVALQLRVNQTTSNHVFYARSCSGSSPSAWKGSWWELVVELSKVVLPVNRMPPVPSTHSTSVEPAESLERDKRIAQLDLQALPWCALLLSSLEPLLVELSMRVTAPVDDCRV